MAAPAVDPIHTALNTAFLSCIDDICAHIKNTPPFEPPYTSAQLSVWQVQGERLIAKYEAAKKLVPQGQKLRIKASQKAFFITNFPTMRANIDIVRVALQNEMAKELEFLDVDDSELSSLDDDSDNVDEIDAANMDEPQSPSAPKTPTIPSFRRNFLAKAPFNEEYVRLKGQPRVNASRTQFSFDIYYHQGDPPSHLGHPSDVYLDLTKGQERVLTKTDATTWRKWEFFTTEPSWSIDKIQNPLVEKVHLWSKSDIGIIWSTYAAMNQDKSAAGERITQSIADAVARTMEASVPGYKVKRKREDDGGEGSGAGAGKRQRPTLIQIQDNVLTYDRDQGLASPRGDTPLPPDSSIPSSAHPSTSIAGVRSVFRWLAHPNSTT